MTTTQTPVEDTTVRRDTLMEKLLGDTVAAMESFSVYLGLRLGLYAALAEGGEATPGHLAARAGIDARYAREWLEQQAMAGIVDVVHADTDGDAGRYRLPGAHREVLLDELSPAYLGPLAYFTGSVAKVLPDLLDVYRTGGGIPYADYGADLRDHVECLNRPMFTNDLADRWLPAIPDVDRRLRSEPPARVADLACGCGWSSIALARAYPKITVVGIDADEDSIAKAQANAADAGVGDRVAFSVADIVDPGPDGRYDAAFLFEALHDLSRPAEALRAIRAILTDGAALIVADERVGETFTAPGDEMERLMYGFSILHCLPASRATEPSDALGTVLRPSVVEGLGRKAGFASVEVLPIDHDLWRFYRLQR